MNKIQIQKIEITNFKGIRSLSADLSGDRVTIAGANGSGKTTIADAICWVLTGCVYDGRAVTGNNVYIQPKEDGKVIMELPHIVTIHATLNGEPLKLQRECTDHYTCPRGSDKRLFDGFENKYYWNDAKISKAEYEARIKSICLYNLLPLINPSIFAKMPYIEQRQLLLQIAGEITWDLVAGDEADKYSRLLKSLKNQDMESLLIELRSAISQMKVGIETKIHQSEGNLMNIFKEEVGEEGLKKQLKECEATISNLQLRIDQSAADSEKAVSIIAARRSEIQRELSRMRDKAAAIEDNARQVCAAINNDTQQHIEDLQKNLNTLRDKAAAMQREATDKLFAEYDARVAAKRDADNLVQEAKQSLDSETAANARLRQSITEAQMKLGELSQAFDTESDKDIDEGEAVMITCPECGSVFETEESKAARAAVRKQAIDRQTATLNDINARGGEINKQIESYQQALKVSEKLLEELSAHHRNLQEKAFAIIIGDKPDEKKISYSEEYRQIQSEIEAKEKRLAELMDKPTITADLTKDPEYRQIQSEIEAKEKELAGCKIESAEDADTAELRKQLEDCRDKESGLKAILARYANNALVMQNDKDLKGQIKNASAKLAELEQSEIMATELNRARYKMIEDRVNRYFKLVRFQMFETCFNGAIKDKCQAIINGVEIADANNADKVNGGVDICNALQQFSNLRLPIIVDNAESVTELLPVDTQMIRLVVADEYKNVQIIK